MGCDCGGTGVFFIDHNAIIFINFAIQNAFHICKCSINKQIFVVIYILQGFFQSPESLRLTVYLHPFSWKNNFSCLKRW